MTPAQRHKQEKLARLAEQKAAAAEAQAHAMDAEPVRGPATIAPSFPADDPGKAYGALSPARQHMQAKMAARAIEAASAADFAPERHEMGADATEYELLMAALGEDFHRLKNIQSKEGKIAAKVEMIDRYSPHVDATLAAALETGKAVQDELLVTMMIWRLDIGDFERGLDIAEHVLRYGLRLPERFQRTPATLIAENVAEAALTASKADKDFPMPVLQRAAQLTADFDMPDVVRAKLCKAKGLHFVRLALAADDAPDSVPAGAAHAARKNALADFRRALELDAKAGVIKDIERLEAWLKKHAPADPAPPEPASADQTTE